MYYASPGWETLRLLGPALLVSFVGWIVVRYARTYLDGEARELWTKVATG